MAIANEKAVKVAMSEVQQSRSKVQARVEGAVAQAIIRHALWPTGARLVVAVSGGPDSLCLLGTLHALRERGSPAAASALLVAHLDHGLRGDDGARDARWVADFAHALGLDCVTERADVSALARRQHRSLEDAARRARYAFLRRIAAQAGAGHICVGHTADDQAETILMHVLRGSGLAGLAGMPYLRDGIARPLLATSRAETVAYCAARGWTPLQDPTNADPAFTRNRIRRDLLPALEAYNPSLRQTLARNAALLADDERLLDALADAEWPRVFVGRSSASVRLARPALIAVAPALRHRIVRRAIHLLSGPEHGPEAAGLLALDALLEDGVTGSSLDLPGRLRARLDYATLVIERHQSGADAAVQAQTAAAEQEWELPAPGVLDLPPLRWRLRAWHSGLPAGLDPADAVAPPTAALAYAGLAGDLARSEMRVYLDADAAGDRLTVRTWRPGDRFRPLGLATEKKVQDVFADAKVPRELRHRLPLVFGARGLVWLGGLRIDDRVRVTPQTRRVLALQLEPLEEAGAGTVVVSTSGR